MLEGRQKQSLSHLLLFSSTKTIYMAGALLSGDVKACSGLQNRFRSWKIQLAEGEDSIGIGKALADKTPLESELKGFRAAEQTARAARGSKKRQRYPEGQLFDPLYQEEHAEELAIRKAKEEEARRKRRIICIPFPLSGRRATQPPRSSTSHLTSKEWFVNLRLADRYSDTDNSADLFKLAMHQECGAKSHVSILIGR
ncbi:hypothetical protein D1P53_001460 [Cryptococcus gattii VGV]|nr:hypothetical protein D1P53_001460 [Cryptococcus gattii VGV]